MISFTGPNPHPVSGRPAEFGFFPFPASRTSVLHSPGQFGAGLSTREAGRAGPALPGASLWLILDNSFPIINIVVELLHSHSARANYNN